MLLSLLWFGRFFVWLLNQPLLLLPKKNQVLLVSRRQAKSSIDFVLIEDYINSEVDDYDVLTLNHLSSNPLQTLLFVMREMYHIARSRAVIVDSYIIPISLVGADSKTPVVQIWHALGAIKQFGHLSLQKPEGSSKKLAKILRMHQGYSSIVASSLKVAGIYAKAFNYDSSAIQLSGMPRLDYLRQISENTSLRAEYCVAHGLDATKKIVLYAPTFRKDGSTPYDQLISELGQGSLQVIARPHPLDASELPASESIFRDDSTELLELVAVADAVITDYSAIAFEAEVLDKPLFLWLVDRDIYSENRGIIDGVIDNINAVQSQSIADILQLVESQPVYVQPSMTGSAFVDESFLDGACTSRLVGTILARVQKT